MLVPHDLSRFSYPQNVQQYLTQGRKAARFIAMGIKYLIDFLGIFAPLRLCVKVVFSRSVRFQDYQ
jgi:hypothetical protein